MDGVSNLCQVGPSRQSVCPPPAATASGRRPAVAACGQCWPPVPLPGRKCEQLPLYHQQAKKAGDHPSALGLGIRSRDKAPWRLIILLTCNNPPRRASGWRIRPGFAPAPSPHGNDQP
ncbi:hypothetical protein GCM10023084_56040 [Streptomyces lacrimifluminis]|uniref:Uncharacterized protein n=1 Tax=Streptomyces lacrimifluminis TaxID=1500077 RepID=A0A917NPL5_9ACTN|nr:hypothetical protein GCM10012282_10610 [Streptomyces lacrimifluminis]